MVQPHVFSFAIYIYVLHLCFFFFLVKMLHLCFVELKDKFEIHVDTCGTYRTHALIAPFKCTYS